MSHKLHQKLQIYTEELEKLKEETKNTVVSTDNEPMTDRLLETIEKITTNAEGMKSDDNRIQKPSEFEKYISQSFKTYTTRIVCDKKKSTEDQEEKENFVSTADSKANKNENTPLVEDPDDSTGIFINENLLVKKGNQKRFVNRMNWTDHDKVFLTENNEILKDNVLIRSTPQDNFDISKGKNKPKTISNYGKFTQFVPGFIWDSSFSDMKNLLKVEIKSIRFTLHRLSSDQFYYTERLKALYRDYIENLQLSREDHLTARIKILRNILKDENECDEIHILDELMQCEENLDNESMKMRIFRDELTSTWHEVNYLREKMRFIETPVALKWKKTKLSDEEKRKEREDYELELAQRAEEILRLNLLLGGEGMEKKAIIETIRQKHRQMGLRLPGESKWVPELVEISITDKSKIPQADADRLEEANNTYIYAKVFAGDVSSTSLASCLSTDFTARINFGTKILVTRIPKFIKLQIWEQSSKGVTKLADATMPVFVGQPTGYSEFVFTSQTATKDGKIQEGIISGAAYIATNPKLTEAQLRENKNRQKAKQKVENSSLPGKVRNDIIKSHNLDPNNPATIEALTRGTPNYSIKTDLSQFSVDTFKKSLSFASMAPTQKYKETLQLKETEKEIKKEEEPITIRNIELDEVVSEQPMPSILNFFLSLFQRKRPLKPVEWNPPKDEFIGKATKLHIRITRITNEPKRTRMCLIPKQINSLGFKSPIEEKCSFYVNAKVGDQAFKTEPVQTVEGRWNAEFEFDLGQLENSQTETLKINLYDQVKYQFPEDICTEDHFLGALEIPISSLENNCKMKGDFLIETPPLQLAYVYPGKTFFFMEVAFSPRLEHTINHPFYCIVNGIKRPLQSLISSHRPPEGVSTIYSLLRLTSMLPWVQSVGDNVETSQEFLQKGYGTSLEHAVFFCNCLLSFGIDASVILADDIFQGFGAFVMTKEDERGKFYDPSNNKAYIGPPFRKPILAFNTRGLWVNQNYENVSLDFEHSNTWNLVRFGSEVVPVQVKDLKYEKSDADIEDLKEKLTKNVKEFITEIVAEKAVWNKSLSNNLESILDNCESAADKRTPPDDADFFSDNSNIRANGAPFCLYYNPSNNSFEDLLLQVTESIQSQKLFMIQGPKTKLGLAVNIYPHPNNIYAIWVFIAGIQQLPKADTGKQEK